MEISRKKLIELFNSLEGIDITYGFEKMDELKKKEEYFKEIAFSRGIYGVTAILLRGSKTGTFYGILNRTSTIFMI